MGSAEVTILGQKYILKGEESEEYMRTLADYVEGKINEVLAAAPGTQSLKVSILAAISIADELYKLRSLFGKIDIETDEIDKLLEHNTSQVKRHKAKTTDESKSLHKT
ncbi:cell division protein ZapA [Candidatus Magnetomonas plexicatena]|uniref:cell division protein ZapA n=1 Tax=Candidatus Magnetomonas plexicatena TaxID=2552947 RepID=UPI0010FFE63F|nr:cell division protein ZapA [Nitrospirales bacterium LBB_01]